MSDANAFSKSHWPTIRVTPHRLVLVLMALLLSVAAGGRWFGVGADYPLYLDIYNGTAPVLGTLGGRFEPGYMLFTFVCGDLLNLPFGVCYALMVALALGLKFRLFWKRLDAPVVAAIIYLLMLYPLHEYTQIRAAVSIGFALTAIDTAFDSKRTSTVLLWLAALAFHYSAVLFLVGSVAVLLCRRRSPADIGLFFLIGTAAAGFLTTMVVTLAGMFNPLASAYLADASTIEAPNPFSGKNVLTLAILIAAALFQRPWVRARDGFFYLLGFMSLISFLSLIAVPVFAHRASEAFLPVLFLFVFRFDASHQSRLPAALTAMLAIWMFREAWLMGIIA